MENLQNQGEIILYQPDNEVKLEVRLENETVWLSIDEMAHLFGRDISVIGKHVRNVFKEGELVKDSVWAKFAYTASDGKTYQVDYYNLDVIISVGYRVKSKRGIAFRKWATKILKDYMIQGYAVNEKRMALLQRKIEVQQTLISGFADMAGLEADEILQVIEAYSQALDLLDDYDHQRITKPQGRK